MNGCQFQLPRFSAPAGPQNISDLRWDYSTLTKEEFIAKWGKIPYMFAEAGQAK
jgi:hypothetical protein